MIVMISLVSCIYSFLRRRTGSFPLAVAVAGGLTLALAGPALAAGPGANGHTAAPQRNTTPSGSAQDRDVRGAAIDPSAKSGHDHDNGIGNDCDPGFGGSVTDQGNDGRSQSGTTSPASETETGNCRSTTHPAVQGFRAGANSEAGQSGESAGAVAGAIAAGHRGSPEATPGTGVLAASTGAGGLGAGGGGGVLAAGAAKLATTGSRAIVLTLLAGLLLAIGAGLMFRRPRRPRTEI